MMKILSATALVFALNTVALADEASMTMLQEQVDVQLSADNSDGVVNMLKQLAESGSEDFAGLLNYVVTQSPELSSQIINELKATDPDLAAQALASIVVTLETMGENDLVTKLTNENSELVGLVGFEEIQPAAGPVVGGSPITGGTGIGGENPAQQNNADEEDESPVSPI